MVKGWNGKSQDPSSNVEADTSVGESGSVAVRHETTQGNRQTKERILFHRAFLPRLLRLSALSHCVVLRNKPDSMERLWHGPPGRLAQLRNAHAGLHVLGRRAKHRLLLVVG